jgi:hypothetical protein
MIKEEALNKMSEGYYVTHKLFAKDEYLYMDDCCIIRNENGTEFEADWDTRISQEWLIDWYIYKGPIRKNTIPKKQLETSNINYISEIKRCPGTSYCEKYIQSGDDSICEKCDIDNKIIETDYTTLSNKEEYFITDKPVNISKGYNFNFIDLLIKLSLSIPPLFGLILVILAGHYMANKPLYAELNVVIIYTIGYLVTIILIELIKGVNKLWEK